MSAAHPYTPITKTPMASAIGVFTFPPPCTVAAALSAAVTSTNSQESAPTSQGHIVCKKNQLEPQPLFGRGPGGGERQP